MAKATDDDKMAAEMGLTTSEGPCEVPAPPCTVATGGAMAKLGVLICHSTPYSKMFLPVGWECDIEWDASGVEWTFRGTNHRVGKALRIPVIVAAYNKNSCRHEFYKDWLLVGYEGAGGY